MLNTKETKNKVKSREMGLNTKETKKSVKSSKAGASKKQETKTFKVSLEELLEAGAHFGHQARRWNPKMKQYIWTEKDGVHIFDLAKTAEKLEEACEYLKKAASEGKQVVLVGTKRQAGEIIKEVATKAEIPFVSERWLGGIITNWEQIKGRISKLADMKLKKEKGEFEMYTKKEKLLLDREIDKLEKFFGGLAGLTGKPEILFVVDTQKERVAVREAMNRGLVIVGLSDTNADPDKVDYLIPANDDALRSIKLIVETVGEAIAQGKKLRAVEVGK